MVFPQTAQHNDQTNTAEKATWVDKVKINSPSTLSGLQLTGHIYVGHFYLHKIGVLL